MVPAGPPPGLPPQRTGTAESGPAIVHLLAEDEAADITAVLSQLRERRDAYGIYRNYYDGRQRLLYSTEKWKNAFGSLFLHLADNLAAAPVDAVADRLELVGFGVEDGPTTAAEMAWQLWRNSRMDRFGRETHVEALRQGDAYIIVWPDDAGVPTLYPQRAECATVIYDEDRPGQVALGAKGWHLHDGRYRLTLYYADRVAKYVTRTPARSGIPERAGDFDRYADERDGGAWPLPHPFGRPPMFHLPNSAAPGEFGTSEIASVLPLQDMLNKSIADMMVAMEFQALPQRWATGLEVPTDPVTGQAIAPFTPGEDRVWSVGSPDVRFGQFEAANLSQFLAVQESFRAEIARVSATPLHYLMLQAGNWPSGAALRTSEIRFLAKVRDRMAAYGNFWEDVLSFAVAMAGGPVVRLSADWTDPEPRSELESVQLAQAKRALGVPATTLWRELGYTEPEIAEMQDERNVTLGQMGLLRPGAGAAAEEPA